MNQQNMTEEQIKQILGEIEAGAFVGTVCQKYQIPRKLINSWKRKYLNPQGHAPAVARSDAPKGRLADGAPRSYPVQRKAFFPNPQSELPEELKRIISAIHKVPTQRPQLKLVIKTVEREMIAYYLRTSKRVVDAYCALGISRTNLDLKRDEYGLKN